MKSNSVKQLISAFLSLVMVFCLLPTATFAVSADTTNDKTSLAPIGPAFDVNSLLAWTAGSDEDGAYSRSVIPLADRTTGFTVNNTANPEAKLMVCSLANSKHDTTSAQGTDSFSSYAFNYWQYATSFVYWSSSKRGNVVVPNGEFTDAAHTNGVPVMGTIFFDWDGNASVVQNFVNNYTAVADKLIELMEYYGFDGYFFNEETGVSSSVASKLNQMIAYMRKQKPDMLIGWYDSICDNGSLSYQDAVNSNNSGWVSAGVNEFFMNYNWTAQKVNTTVSTMQGMGKSQYDAFAGLDVQQNCMNTTFNSSYLLNNNKLKLSLALYCPNSTMGLATDGANFHEVERQFYVNGGDPRNTTSSGWQGMSRFFADHTTILSAPFVTNFNAGHGKAYYVDGVKSRNSEWSYQSVQDVMPTWTWIIDSNGNKLSGSYDFDDAYNGGSSIKFSGSLSAGQPNNIMLYSTKLAINGSTNISLTSKGDQGCMKLVAYYGDSTTASYESCQTKEYTLNASSGNWVTSAVSLSDLSGKTLYAIGLKIESSSAVSNYQVNLGQLAITDSSVSGASVSNVSLEDILFKDAYTAEARLTWNGNASSYEIYKINADGSKNLIMETPNTAYYISNLTRNEDEQDKMVTVEIVPVDNNGHRQAGQELIIDWPYQNGDTERLVDTASASENVCLGAEVTGYSAQNDGEPASKAIDGTSENGSKWCATNAQSGWMSIKLKETATVRRWRVEHAEYGGEAQNMNTISFELQYKSGNGWKTAKSITNNSAAVTDVTLDQPVTAQEWRLYINNSGSSAWGAIRIYEWQMFESAEQEASEPVLMKFASAVNNPGAADTFTLRNVPAGTTIKLYLKDSESYRQIAEQSGSGTVSFTGLDFGSGAGRVYYTTTTGNYAESIKLSAPFDAEEGAVYQVIISSTENGTVAADVMSGKAGDIINLTATPAEYYELAYFTVNGEKIDGNSFSMPENDVTVSAVFKKVVFTIAIEASENGNVKASSMTAKAGETVTLTAVPNEGYELSHFTLDGEIVESSFSMPERDVIVSAVFQQVTQELEENLALNAEVIGYNKSYKHFKETGPVKLFDGDKTAKWTASGGNGWVVFDIGNAADIKTMKVFHAGSAGEDSKLNTVSYELYVLNENLITEEAFAKLSASEQSRLCAIPRYWTKVLVKTDNTNDITVDQIELDHARRYFKFNARKTNSLGHSYSVNIYELELYANNTEMAF